MLIWKGYQIIGLSVFVKLLHTSIGELLRTRILSYCFPELQGFAFDPSPWHWVSIACSCSWAYSCHLLIQVSPFPLSDRCQSNTFSEYKLYWEKVKRYCNYQTLRTGGHYCILTLFKCSSEAIWLKKQISWETGGHYHIRITPNMMCFRIGL